MRAVLCSAITVVAILIPMLQPTHATTLNAFSFTDFGWIYPDLSYSSDEITGSLAATEAATNRVESNDLAQFRGKLDDRNLLPPAAAKSRQVPVALTANDGVRSTDYGQLAITDGSMCSNATVLFEVNCAHLLDIYRQLPVTDQ
jgi:hypothetical protein